jgi:hypothetical protein
VLGPWIPVSALHFPEQVVCSTSHIGRGGNPTAICNGRRSGRPRESSFCCHGNTLPWNLGASWHNNIVTTISPSTNYIVLFKCKNWTKSNYLFKMVWLILVWYISFPALTSPTYWETKRKNSSHVLRYVLQFSVQNGKYVIRSCAIFTSPPSILSDSSSLQSLVFYVVRSHCSTEAATVFS